MTHDDEIDAVIERALLQTQYSLREAITRLGYRAKDDTRESGLRRAAEIVEDDEGRFSVWGEYRNTRVAQQVCADIAAAILAEIGEKK